MIKHVFSINLEKIYTALLGQIRKCIFWSIEILPSNANPFLPFCLVFLIFLAFFIYHDRLWRIGCSNMSFPWLIPFRAANHPLPFRFIFCLFVFFWLKMTFWLCTFCLHILSQVLYFKWFQMTIDFNWSLRHKNNR